MPASFDLYKFGDYRGLEDLADFSRYVEFYGQMQRGLKKVDMASMHNSLEVRVPLLDREVIDLSLRIDPFASLRDGKRKLVLEDALARSVPRTSIPQTKRGFSVPLRTWLQDGWRDMVEETLFGSESSRDLFDRGRLWQYWEDHLSGRHDHKWGLWTLLSFEWWRQRMRKRRIHA
jgi:asparagine synthase (glutamine-hydrolysing)